MQRLRDMLKAMQGDLLGDSSSYFELALTVTWHILPSCFLLVVYCKSLQIRFLLNKTISRTMC